MKKRPTIVALGGPQCDAELVTFDERSVFRELTGPVEYCGHDRGTKGKFETFG